MSKHLWNASYLASLKPFPEGELGFFKCINLNIQHASYLLKYTCIVLLIIKFEIWYFWYINIPMNKKNPFTNLTSCCDFKKSYICYLKRSGHADLFSSTHGVREWLKAIPMESVSDFAVKLRLNIWDVSSVFFRAKKTVFEKMMFEDHT